jgi:hypothetical protein
VDGLSAKQETIQKTGFEETWAGSAFDRTTLPPGRLERGRYAAGHSGVAEPTVEVI